MLICNKTKPAGYSFVMNKLQVLLAALFLTPWKKASFNPKI